jgi:hypothetical protein
LSTDSLRRSARPSAAHRTGTGSTRPLIEDKPRDRAQLPVGCVAARSENLPISSGIAVAPPYRFEVNVSPQTVPAPVAVVTDLDALAAALAERIGAQSPRTTVGQPEPYLCVEEAARYIAATKQRIYDLNSQGRLRCVKDGARLLTKRASLRCTRAAEGPEGTLLRFERQHRFAKEAQPPAERLARDGDPEAMWLDGFEEWARAAERLVIGGTDAAQRHLVEKVERGELQREKAERLVGSLAIARMRGEGWWRDLGKPHLGHRRRRELADHEVALAPSAKPEREVPLGEAIGALRAAWKEPPTKQAEPTSAERRTKRKRGAMEATAQRGRSAS